MATTKLMHMPIVNNGELPLGIGLSECLALLKKFEDSYQGPLGASGSEDIQVRSLSVNNLAALTAINGDVEASRLALTKLVSAYVHCEPARLNLALIESESNPSTLLSEAIQLPLDNSSNASARPVRIAILSFLFNWPSSGGGIVHTIELTKFLVRAGYEVRHFYPVCPEFGIGRVDASMLIESQPIDFRDIPFHATSIRERFRQAVERFDPDYVLITDAWNAKPILAEAVRAYPYFLRFQALECLCPLNNLRLLPQESGPPTQCRRHQLATPDACRHCLHLWGETSGDLHRRERALAGVGTPEYDRTLRRALEDAEAVLVLNPLTEAMLAPYARRVSVVPWGMDPDRFPWPPPNEPDLRSDPSLKTIFMAGLTDEYIKGFHVARQACRRLRQSRSDFELVVTSDPAGRLDEFTRSVGWISQKDLPRYYRSADICIVPTVAQDGLSRTSVEAMASGVPVVASRIGGLPWTVTDGLTGLLFEPGNPDDLARKLATLLDDPARRREMGLAGRRRFEEDFTWPSVIERHYRPLLTPRVRASRSR